jgi:uncharacterized protein
VAFEDGHNKILCGARATSVLEELMVSFDTIERMAVSVSSPDLSRNSRLTRRRFLKATLWGAAGLALYAGEVERHWIEITQEEVHIPGLAAAFDGMRIAQLSDLHMDEYSEPFFLRRAVDHVNELKPDAVFLTGDYVTAGITTRRFAEGAAWQCANLLTALECRTRYAILGNHDVLVNSGLVAEALADNGMTVLVNACLPIERAGARFWLAGLDDAVEGRPDAERAIPPQIRHIAHEPVILMCHAPDYADRLLAHPAGQAVAVMVSGHTHGGQVRLPFVGAMELPKMGRKYVEGWFHLQGMQLYVNRGLGTVGVPFRFYCQPEITLFTLRAA